MTHTIEVKNLNKSFGDNAVLQGMEFHVDQGESFVIIGGSGTGKSVLLKCILGLIQADSGSISIDGTDISKGATKVPEILERISMLFQGSALFDSMKVWENVSFLLLQQGVNRQEAKQRAIEKLAQVGLQPKVADIYPSELSGGMQRRVALARAIVTDPDIIFFDEPTSGLDPITASVIYDLILKCVREIGATAITITHDISGAKRIADRIGLLYEGNMIWQGTPAEMEGSSNAFIQQFTQGSSEGPIQVKI